MDSDDLESEMEEIVTNNLEDISHMIMDIGRNIDELCQNPYYIGYELKSNVEYLTKIGCPIFRGQMDHRWQLLSGMERNPNGNVLDVIRYKAAECRLVHALQSSDVFLENNRLIIRGITTNTRLMQIQYEEYAQHYGFKTDLLDWTMDPKVALFFACTDGNLNGCTPLSERDMRDIGMSSLFISNYRLSLEDNVQGPRVIGAGILQRSLFQKGFVSKGYMESRKIDFPIDQSYCEEIAKEFDYGRKLTDIDSPDQISKAFQRIRDQDIVPKACIGEICKATRIPYRDIIGIMEEGGMEIADWDYIDSISPDIGHVLDRIVYAHIDDHVTIAERCMDGHVMTLDEAYELFTSIKLKKRLYRETMGYLRSPDSFWYLSS